MADSPRLSTAILGSSFGRRLFIMFCLAALLPTAVVFWMTYRTATDDAEASRRLALREGGKNFALSVFERLQIADGALAAASADRIAKGEDRKPGLEQMFFADRETPIGLKKDNLGLHLLQQHRQPGLLLYL